MILQEVEILFVISNRISQYSNPTKKSGKFPRFEVVKPESSLCTKTRNRKNSDFTNPMNTVSCKKTTSNAMLSYSKRSIALYANKIVLKVSKFYGARNTISLQDLYIKSMTAISHR